MRVYVASRLENAAAVRQAYELLRAAGHEITYDWTVHGSVWREGVERLRDVAAAELCGVVGADFVVVLLPGGRGTHAELGAALVLGIPTYVVALPEAGAPLSVLGAAPETCAFYHHLCVKKIAVETVERAVSVVLNDLADQEADDDNSDK